ncbi:guanine nucleotide exchange factor MSS4 homolog [Tigriopus californicus]|uniref:guanine nucleotide exchange factor MSS4 homolog n=1 Tax=Tigriopus californicus TaxID=6832 RepID=UPI0027D9FBC9|nr:guanine nucleotide exchange factor MSS4 homolog [Tigriopus californicus]
MSDSNTIVGKKVDTSSLVDEKGKNLKQIVCERCASKILPAKVGTLEEFNFELNIMKKESETDSDLTKEQLSQFYRVEDMFDFDNIGFSHTVGDIKYLICADCEIGPVGWHSISSKKCYVALTRVAYK